MENNNFKRYLLAPVLVSVLLGTGYGVSKAVKAPDAATTPPTKAADVPMVPGNFSELAETVRPGVVNIQVVKKVKNVAFGSL